MFEKAQKTRVALNCMNLDFLELRVLISELIIYYTKFIKTCVKMTSVYFHPFAFRLMLVVFI